MLLLEIFIPICGLIFSAGFVTYALISARLRFKKLINLGADPVPKYSDKEILIINKCFKICTISLLIILIYVFFKN